MTHAPRWLLVFELSALICWVILAFSIFVDDDRDQLQPLTLGALEASSSEERWNGIFFEEQHVGYAVTRTSVGKDGSLLLEQRSRFRVATFGKIQEIVTAGAALTTPEGLLQQFDFFFASDLARISARGAVQQSSLVMQVDQAGETSEISFPIDEPPHVGISLEAAIRNMTLEVGKSFSLPYFDPISFSKGSINLKVFDSIILENGEEAWWIKSTFGDIETRFLVSTTGDVLRQEGAMGIAMVRMTPEDAQNVPTQDDPVDLIALSAVKLTGKIKNPRKLKHLVLKIKGVPAEKFVVQPPLQDLNGDLLTVNIPELQDLSEMPVALSNPTADDRKWLYSTLNLPSEHPEILERAQSIVAGSEDRLEAVKRLNDFVFDHMQKIPSIGVPNGLQALRNAQGDCNEHTALFVSLARAVNIPSRIAVGLVYSSRSGPVRGFYYHAWPEVRFGDIWLPIDPTFGQLPADATHLKVAHGDLDQQLEIMGLLGQIALELPQKIIDGQEQHQTTQENTP